jgi:hypothetical protein
MEVELNKPEKLSSEFEQHLQKYETIFQEGYDRVMSEVKDKIKDVENFVTFVVHAMNAVKDADLHGIEKKDIVVDIVRKVVDAMPITDEEKVALKARAFPTIEAIIDALVYASKGYMYLAHQAEQLTNDLEEGCAKCAGKCRGCRRQKGQKGQKRQKARGNARVIKNKMKLKAKVKTTENLDISSLVDDVYNNVKNIIRHKEITLSNLVSIGSIIMQIVEEYPALAGYQKKQLVLSVAHRLVDEFEMDQATKEVIKVAIDTTLSKTIDFIIKASRGEIEVINNIIAKIEQGCAKCC